jgi:glycerol-3-phosphate dehydrogenase (NAD(P)+)
MHMGIIGAGGWGSALAVSYANAGWKVTIWAHNVETASEINERHTNCNYLPGVDFPHNIKATASFEFLQEEKIVLLMTPAQHIRSVVKEAKQFFDPEAVIVHGAKGIERGSLKRISEVIKEETAGAFPVLVLSGPTHSEEVARQMPTACVLAGNNQLLLKEMQNQLMLPSFRINTSEDVIGVEIGGSLKNVMAIATGIADGIGYGDNAKGALVTRGLAEMAKLGVRMGANPLTFAGLSGMGDLIATCTSSHSRNRQAGIALAQGKSLNDIQNSSKMVVEGAFTASAAYKLGLKYEVELPIVREVVAVLEGLKSPAEIAGLLMTREAQEELNYLLQS